jgi:arsenite methyltransferase
LQEAGFGQMEIMDTASDLNAYAKVEPQSECCCCGSKAKSPAYHKGMSDLCSQYDFNEYAASVKIYAVKR